MYHGNLPALPDTPQRQRQVRHFLSVKGIIDAASALKKDAPAVAEKEGDDKGEDLSRDGAAGKASEKPSDKVAQPKNAGPKVVARLQRRH